MKLNTLSTILVAAALMSPLAAFSQSADRVLEATAALKPATPKTGEVTLEVVFTEATRPVAGLKLISSVAMTNMDMGTAHPAVKETTPGHYTLKPMLLMDGPWRVTLVSADPKFKVDFDMTAGAKEPWKPAKQTIKIASAAAPAEQKPKEEPAKTEPPKQDPAKTEPPKQEPAKQEPPKEDPAKAEQTYGHEGHVASSLPKLGEKNTYTWTGKEEWDTRTGFGKLEPMVRMMILMMVAGSGMEGMKMAPVALVFNEANFTEGDAQSMDMDAQTLKVEAKLDKPAVGDNNVTFTIADKDGKPVEKAKVTTAVAMTNMDMGTAHPAVKELGKGKYAVKANFSMVGPWRLTLVVAAPGGKAETYNFDFEAK
ncbi:MAG: FixH family protein [Armatimonadetes bacterium]|nr:FixH family protein [Armatimonadota bacterium]